MSSKCGIATVVARAIGITDIEQDHNYLEIIKDVDSEVHDALKNLLDFWDDRDRLFDNINNNEIDLGYLINNGEQLSRLEASLRLAVDNRIKINLTATNASSYSYGNVGVNDFIRGEFSPGSGVGIAIDESYQPVIFDQGFDVIELYHDGECVAPSVVISKNNRGKLIGIDISRWIVKNGMHRFAQPIPTRFRICQISKTNGFEIKVISIPPSMIFTTPQT